MDPSVEQDFTDFVVRRSHALLRLAYALTGDAHTAEDLTQQALCKAFVHWRRIDGDAESYVKKIIYRDCASRWRRRATRAETSVAMPPEVTVPDASQDAHLRLMLREAVLALPPRQRAVLVLRYFEDLSVEETADVLGCRPGTVASQASRALVKLRRLLPDETRYADTSAGLPKEVRPWPIDSTACSAT